MISRNPILLSLYLTWFKSAKVPLPSPTGNTHTYIQRHTHTSGRLTFRKSFTSIYLKKKKIVKIHSHKTTPLALVKTLSLLTASRGHICWEKSFLRVKGSETYITAPAEDEPAAPRRPADRSALITPRRSFPAPLPAKDRISLYTVVITIWRERRRGVYVKAGAWGRGISRWDWER